MRKQPERYTEKEARELLAVEIEKAGSISAYSRKTGISVGYLSDTLSGNAPIRSKVMDALGLIRVEVFERINGKRRR